MTCLLSNNDVTDTVETGHLAFVLVLTFVTLNVPNHEQMLTTYQWLCLQSRFIIAVLETIKLVLI